jgi:hypothetical protein
VVAAAAIKIVEKVVEEEGLGSIWKHLELNFRQECSMH